MGGWNHFWEDLGLIYRLGYLWGVRWTSDPLTSQAPWWCPLWEGIKGGGGSGKVSDHIRVFRQPLTQAIMTLWHYLKTFLTQSDIWQQFWKNPECKNSGMVQNLKILEWSKTKHFWVVPEHTSSGMTQNMKIVEWSRTRKFWIGQVKIIWNGQVHNNSYIVQNVKFLKWWL